MASNVDDRATWGKVPDGAKGPADHISLDEREIAALAEVAEGSAEIIRTEGTEEKRDAS